MVAFMNEEALRLTQETGRLRISIPAAGRQLWKKGETSGNILNVKECGLIVIRMLIWLKAEPAGPTCHTGEQSCFYRRLDRWQRWSHVE